MQVIGRRLRAPFDACMPIHTLDLEFHLMYVFGVQEVPQGMPRARRRIQPQCM